MPHDDYYYNLAESANGGLARAVGAVREPRTCEDRFEILADVFGPTKAAVLESFMDGKIAHHELNEHKV